MPGKGRPYFAYQLLTSRGREEYGHGWPVEVAFNYLGQLQQLSRSDAILQPSDDGVGQGINSSSDIGKDVPRLSLVEVTAMIVGGQMQISFSCNRHMKNRESLQRWVRDCDTILREAPRRLAQHTPEKTLGLFPLLPLSYYGLENLEQRLRDVGVPMDGVADVYPCSPMQRGLLLSQIRDPEKYGYRAIFRVDSTRSEDVDLERLSNAWQAVVHRHTALRTTFVDTVGDEGLMDQVVLRNFTGRIEVLPASSDEDALQTLQTMHRIDYNQKQPPHRLSLCRTSQGDVFCSLEVSHAICDGSSVPILLDDLADAYDIGVINRPVPLYRDYIAYMQSRSPSQSSRYWKEYLNGAEPCLFPSLTGGEEISQPSLESHAITLSSTARLNEYCLNSGITLSTLLQFVWALVVRSYTGSDEVMFGYLASGRDVPIEHIGNAVGVFINMLVCRLQLTADTEIGEALETMQTDLANAMTHQNCSLAEIQHELQLPGAALFNTAFTYQKRSAVTPSSTTALRFDVVSAEDPSEYSVAVNVEATHETVEVHFGYWTNIISDAQIRNIADTFEQALSDLIADRTDDRTVGELRLVGPAAMQNIRSWNDFELPRVEKCVHHLIEQHALQLPASTPAVCGWDTSFTYLELDKAASTLAQHLVTVCGVGPEVFVPLCFEKSAWTVIAQLAVLKAGGAFVNLDPSHPDTRLKDLIQEVGAKMVLSSAANKAKMDTIAEKAFVVDDESISALSKALVNAIPPPASTVKPSNAAYIVFTSGTTGKPKGTVVEHAAFCTSGLAHAKAMFMGAGSRVLQFASYTFDASIMETLSCLLVGGCVCVPSDGQRMNDVAGVIREMGVTWTLLTPSVASTVKPESVPCLKTLVTGGEAMAAGHISRWGTQCALVNAYGPTECSVVATTSTKVDESRRMCNTDRSNIGTAVGGRVWVVDLQNPDHLVPVGAVGELVVEGRLVARGYLNNKEQTDKAFIQSPAWTRNSAFPDSMWRHQDRMYRTGDLVRYNSDGSIAYIARKDTQVKLNGRRIELGEIEFHCRAGLPDGARAVVVVVSLQQNTRATAKSLAVFFSLPNGGDAAPNFSLLPLGESLRKPALDLEAHLSRHLPAFMVPQLFVPISTMPWTSAGKLDRKRLLQALEEATQQAITSYRLSTAAATRRGPTSEMEKKLQSLWETVLGLAAGSVSAGDSFFRLGGDSLTAMRLVGAARVHKIALTVLDVFEKPVLSDMARACGGVDALVPVSSNLKPFELFPCPQGQFDDFLQEVCVQCQLSRDQIRDVYPCSPLQEGLVTLASQQTGAYVAVNTLRLPEQVDLDRFKAAWQQVVDETDILRTRIVHTAGSGFLQVVAAPGPIEWHQEQALVEATAKGQALGLHSGGPLTRYSMIEESECGNEGRLFVWAIHHALYDGWSLRLIANRVQQVYSNQMGTPNGTLAHAPFAHFIHYLKQHDPAASERFWTDFLGGAATSVSHFPPLPSTLAAQTDTPAYHAETGRVKLPRSKLLLDVTIPTLIRAAWAIVLAAYTGMEDVVFGETLAGRNIDVSGVGEMAGPTFTTVPARVRLDHGMRLSQFLRDLHAMASQMVPHQHMGLQHIKRLDPDCAGASEFQNLLVIQMANSSSSSGHHSNSERQGHDIDWDFQAGSSANSFFTHPLVLECNIEDTSVEATFHHNAKVLSSWHTKRLVHQFEAVLTQLVDKSSDNEFLLGGIHVLSPKDQALLGRWNRRAPFRVNSCVHNLFQTQASLDPHRPAIEAWDAALTYSQLHEHSSRLALHLTQRGIKRGVLVPVCLERSAWSAVILLGILMADGAFVPLDPTQPPARHQDILESIKADVIICSPEHASRFSGMVDKVVAVDGDIVRNLPSTSQTEPRPHPASPTDTAYVLFTSGSTGRPKGVVVAHRDFCSSSRAYAAATHMNLSSRVFHFASLTFDAALLEVLTPLTLGACVCIPTAHDRLHNLGDSMSRLRATWSFLTPSVANMLDPDSVPTLKTLVCGGEAMLSETVSRWADRVELMNGYGPTEASVFAAVNPLVSMEKNPAVIGRGTAASHLWIVEPRADRNDRLAPVGAIGELAISGPLLARGYLNEPEKTAQAFIENPGWARKAVLTGVAPPTRIYRTGDLVRYRPDGALEFVGRRDGQVKVNGQRIELGEIESRLSADRHVNIAVVVQPKAGPGKKKLVAILTLASTTGTVEGTDVAESTAGGRGDCKPLDGPPDQLAQARAEMGEIQARLGETLPQYMVPTVWIALRAMPVMVSGKLDRRRVTSWVESLDDSAYGRVTGGVDESSEDKGDEDQVDGLVKTLREIWARELSLPVARIKLNQPFLALGKSFLYPSSSFQSLTGTNRRGQHQGDGGHLASPKCQHQCDDPGRAPVQVRRTPCSARPALHGASFTASCRDTHRGGNRTTLRTLSHPDHVPEVVRQP